MSDLFKLEGFVADKDLARVMRLLASCNVRDLSCVPVINAKATAKGIESFGNNVTEIVRDLITTHRINKVNRADVFQMLHDCGWPSPASGATSALKNLVKAKFLKRQGKGTKYAFYIVNRSKRNEDL